MATPVPNNLDFITRFVCTGTEEGCHNVSGSAEFNDKIPSLDPFLNKEKGLEAVRRLKRIFERRSYVTKNPLLYTLAKIIRHTPVHDKDHEEDTVRQEAYNLAIEACETPMDLFTFVDFDKRVSLKQEEKDKKPGWGKGMKRLVRNWYESKNPLVLAREVTKCKSGRGWKHRDLIKQCHLNPEKKSQGTSVVLQYLTHGKKVLDQFKDSESAEVEEVVIFLKALEALISTAHAEKELIRGLIEQHKLTERQIPSHLFQVKETFDGLLGHMEMTDVFRNIPRMASLGMLDHIAPEATRVLDCVKNVQAIKDQKVPPIVIFFALRKYESNRFKKWVKNTRLVRAMHAAFFAAIQTMPMIGKRTLLAVHVDSKVSKHRVSGANYLTPIMPCSLMAQFLIQTEDNAQVVFFHQKIVELNFHRKIPMAGIVENFVVATKEAGNSPYDLSEPLKWATQKKKPFDNILIMSEKKSIGSQQEFYDAINHYRTEVALPNAKVAIIGLSDNSTIVNRHDLNMLEVTGFNEKVPTLIYNFFKGQLDFSADDDNAAAGGEAAAASQ